MSLRDRAERVIPGGVSSPARAFGAVEGDPVFAVRGDGGWLEDADGHRYLDLIQGFGAVILGHAHPAVTEAIARATARGGAVGLSTEAEVRLAELVVERVPTVERVRFVTSGTEAGMTAARVARGATGRDLLVAFAGCYHGHADAFLAEAGSGAATFSVPKAAGVPASAVEGTVVLPYNDAEALGRFLAERGPEVAAVFVEPVAANMGVVLPDATFLPEVLRAARAHGALVVFDEVVTGFRLASGGAQELFGLEPDLTMLGKVLGGGLPIGAVGGSAELMDVLAPAGPVYQAGTYAAHPHAMAAGAAALGLLEADAYATLASKASALAEAMRDAARRTGVTMSVARAETFLSPSFAATPPRDLAEAKASDRDAFARFHRALREEGVLAPPSPFEAWFPSLAHSDEDIERIGGAVERALRSI